eukprot:jgi/Astpho2/1717/Aster-04142
MLSIRAHLLIVQEPQVPVAARKRHLLQTTAPPSGLDLTNFAQNGLQNTTNCTSQGLVAGLTATSCREPSTGSHEGILPGLDNVNRKLHQMTNNVGSGNRVDMGRKVKQMSDVGQNTMQNTLQNIGLGNSVGRKTLQTDASSTGQDLGQNLLGSVEDDNSATVEQQVPDMDMSNVGQIAGQNMLANVGSGNSVGL